MKAAFPNRGYACFVLYNASTSGGHIYSHGKGGPLCGIDKRLPHHAEEIHAEHGDFEKWFRANEGLMCATCERIFNSKLDTPTVPQG